MNNTEPSVLHHDENLKQFRIELHQGDWSGRAFDVKLSCCPDPMCHCRDIILDCSPVASDSQEESEKVLVVLDYIDRCIAESSKDREIETSELAEEIVKEATDADWLTLRKHFFATKRDGMKELDPASTPVQLPREFLADPTLMPSYTEFFPYDDILVFSLGDTTWVLEDQYCVNPKCTCSNAALSFYPAATDEDDPNAPRDVDFPAVFFDLAKGQVTSVAQSAKGMPSPRQLASALFEQQHDCLELLKSRRAMLYALVKHNMPKPQLPFRQQSNVGRNDPCPCGSGKKYKKCCGR